jgi:hypothetical protein
MSLSPGTLWLDTESGMRRYDIARGTFEPLPIATPIDAVSGNTDQVWIASREGPDQYVLYRLRAAALERVVWPAELRGDEPNLYARGDQLWAWSLWYDQALQRWDGQRWQRIPLSSPTMSIEAWGSATDDLWFVGEDYDRHPVILHWDGVRLTQDVAGIPGQGVHAISGSARYIYLGSNGILRGAR